MCHSIVAVKMMLMSVRCQRCHHRRIRGCGRLTRFVAVQPVPQMRLLLCHTLSKPRLPSIFFETARGCGVYVSEASNGEEFFPLTNHRSTSMGLCRKLSVSFLVSLPFLPVPFLPSDEGWGRRQKDGASLSKKFSAFGRNLSKACPGPASLAM